MKRIAMVAVVLAVCLSAFGQDKTKQQSTPAPQTQAQGAATQAATPPGKRPPQAKTQPEFEAYKTAMALTDVAAQERPQAILLRSFPTANCVLCCTSRPCRNMAALATQTKCSNSGRRH